MGQQLTKSQIITQLEQLATDDRRQHSQRLGVSGVKLLGVPMTDVRRIAKTVGNDPQLSNQLWATQIHEAQMIAVLCLAPKDFTAAQATRWLQQVQTWDLCDLICKSVARGMPADTVRNLIRDWAHHDHIYVRRAALSIIANIAIHSKHISNNDHQIYCDIILHLVNDEQLHIKKAASWALRELGKRSALDHQIILDHVYEMREKGSPNAQWVAKDALKELDHLIAVPERKRLISTKTQTGRKALAARQKS